MMASAFRQLPFAPKTLNGLPLRPLANAPNMKQLPVVGGLQEFVRSATGSFSFTVPLGVNAVSIVCIGAGASGEQTGMNTLGNKTGDSDGGGGGNLRWINSLRVFPGETLTVVVGEGGVGEPSVTLSTGAAPSRSSTPGTSSFVERQGTVIFAAGGAAGAFDSNKTQPDTTVNGGEGSAGENGSTIAFGLGGNAGGYFYDADDNTEDGSFLYGIDPKTGSARNIGLEHGAGGRGDSTSNTTVGASSSASPGQDGGVRIIWGKGASFPFNAI